MKALQCAANDNRQGVVVAMPPQSLTDDDKLFEQFRRLTEGNGG